MLEKAFAHSENAPQEIPDSAKAWLKKPEARQRVPANDTRGTLENNPFGEDDGRAQASLRKPTKKEKEVFQDWKSAQIIVLEALGIKEDELISFVKKGLYVFIDFIDDNGKRVKSYGKLRSMDTNTMGVVLYGDVDRAIRFQDIKDISVVGKNLNSSQRKMAERVAATLTSREEAEELKEEADALKKEKAEERKAKRKKEVKAKVEKLRSGNKVEKAIGTIARALTEEEWERQSRKVYEPRIKEMEAEERYWKEKAAKEEGR